MCNKIQLLRCAICASVEITNTTDVLRIRMLLLADRVAKSNWILFLVSSNKIFHPTVSSSTMSVLQIDGPCFEISYIYAADKANATLPGLEQPYDFKRILYLTSNAQFLLHFFCA